MRIGVCIGMEKHNWDNFKKPYDLRESIELKRIVAQLIANAPRK